MRILFIGNSHTYNNNLPRTVRLLIEATGIKTHITLLSEPGKPLSYFVQNRNVRFNIENGEYDFVVAQDHVSGFDPADFRQSASKLSALCAASGARLCLYMPASGVDNTEVLETMLETYLAFCRENNCIFAPAGEVFTRVAQSTSGPDLYREDNRHASPSGGYAAAVTVFYALTARRRVLPADRPGDPGPAAGLPLAFCQRVHTEACHTVRLYNG